MNVLKTLGLACVIVAAVVAAISGAACAASPVPLYPSQFEWPAAQARAHPDPRLGPFLADASDEVRQAAQLAKDAETLAAQAKRLVEIRTSIGRGPRPMTVSEGVTMMAVGSDDPHEAGKRLGTLTWSADGSSLQGLVSSSVGAFSPAADSGLREFRGGVSSIENAIPTPMTGIFDFKNGDVFTGSYNTGHNASGVYVAADGARRFVGEVNFAAASVVPLNGQMEDASGRLLANVRSDGLRAPAR